MSGFLHSQLSRAVNGRSADSVVRRDVLRLARVAAIAFAAVVVGAGPAAAPASAHENLVRAVPADGSTVTSPPAQVQLVFDEKAGNPAGIVVTGPSGEQVNRGPVGVADNTVSVRVDVQAAGRYTVAYRVVSADGHPVSGETKFRFAPGGTAQPGSAQPVTEEHDEHAEPAAHAEQGGTNDGATGDGPGRGPVAGLVAGAALLAGIGLLTVRRRPGDIGSSGSNPARKARS